MKFYQVSISLLIAQSNASGMRRKISAADKIAKARVDRQKPRKLNAEYSCFGQNDFNIYFTGECDYDHLVEEMELKVEEDERCINSGAEEVQLLVGVVNQDESVARERVRQLCIDSTRDMLADPNKSLPWSQVTGLGDNFDSEFYDGHSFWNEERQTDYDSIYRGEPSNKLKYDAERARHLYETAAERVPFQWPNHIDNFENCEVNAVMCCWVQDRQDDDDGNCDSPYDDRCIDKDPADNTEICAVDMSRSPKNVEDGSIIFRGNVEGSTHCHGTAWSTDELHPSNKYKANNLFYISQYDHLYKRGYVTNVPGAPMCGCVEKMPIVTRADCTEIDVKEYWKFQWIASLESFTIILDRAEIDFETCDGSPADNDLRDYFKKLYEDDLVSWDDFESVKRTVVDDNDCYEGTDAMMFDKGYEEYYPPVNFDSHDGQLYSVKVYDGTDSGKDYLYTERNGDVKLVSTHDNARAQWRLYPRQFGSFEFKPNPESSDLEEDENYLASSRTGAVSMSSSNYGNGRQLWRFRKLPGTDNVYNIMIAGGTEVDEQYLSTNTGGNPELANKDGDSGRQQWIIELLDETFVPTQHLTNIASKKPALQSSTSSGKDADEAVDRDTASNSYTATEEGSDNWWQVHLLDMFEIKQIKVYNRTDSGATRLDGFRITIFNESGDEVWNYTNPPGTPPHETIVEVGNGISGSVVKVSSAVGSTEKLNLAEVMVMGYD